MTMMIKRVGTRAALIGMLLAASAWGMTDAVAPVAAAPPPATASVFTPMAPQRLVDTRIGLGAPAGRLPASTPLDIQVTGRLGIPDAATAVVVNVTAVGASGPGFLQVLPTGRAALGSASTLNVDAANQIIPNAAFAPLGDGGRLTVYAIFATDVVIDVAGYFTPAMSAASGRLVPLTPQRILDTRINLGWTAPAPPPPPPTTQPPTTQPPTTQPPTTPPPTTPGRPANPGDTKNCTDFASYAAAKQWFDTYFPYYGDVAKLDQDNDGIPCESLAGAPRSAAAFSELVSTGTTIRLQVAGRGGVPLSGVAAVVMNVTAVNPSGGGYVQVAPTPVTIGASSNLNTAPGITIANLVVVPLGSGGGVDLYSTTNLELVADVVGYFTDSTAPVSTAGLFVPITPDRQADTRTSSAAPVPGGSVTGIDINDITPDAIAVSGNLTATEAAQPGYLQLAAHPVAVGQSSSVNIAYIGQTIANAVVSPVSAGRLDAYTLTPTHLLLDVTGWFTAP